jgi:hypothetical protein
LIAYGALNLAGLIGAVVTGHWELRQLYDRLYFPLAVSVWLLGALGQLPRVRASTKGEGHERRFFYGTVWAMCAAQPALWIMWKFFPAGRMYDAIKLGVFVVILALMAELSRRGVLPRTREIVPGEVAVSD